jgi:hypothetical protein
VVEIVLALGAFAARSVPRFVTWLWATVMFAWATATVGAVAVPATVIVESPAVTDATFALAAELAVEARS